MSKTVKIPDCMSPFVVMVNGVKYVYPAGEMMEVPDAVANVIEHHQAYHNFIEKSNNGETNPGGDAAATDFLTLVETMTVYKNETAKRIPKNAFNGCAKLKVLDFTALEYAWGGIGYGDVNEDGFFYFTVPSPIPTNVQALVNRGGLFQAGFRNVSDCDIPGEDQWTSNVSNTLYVYVPREFIVEENFINRGGGQWDEENPPNFAYGADWEVWWNANRIRAIEDYTVDGTVTGALDFAKMGIE